MNRKLTTIALLLLSMQSFSQVGVGTIHPNQSTELEIVSNDKGILIPRVSLANLLDTTTITNGNVNSLLVYNINKTSELAEGYYYWYIDKWVKVINEEDFVYNDNLTVIGSELVLVDTEGNTVSIELEAINLPDVETSLIYNQATGILSYINEESVSQDFDLKDVVKNFETLTILSVNTQRGVLTYTDEADDVNEIDLKELVRTHQKTYSFINGEHTIANTLISGNNAEFKIDVNTNTIAPALGNNLTIGDNSVVVNNGTGATLVETSVKVKSEGITTDKLGQDAVTNEKLADNSVKSENILNGTILTADLADGSITSSKIVNRTIIEEDLADGAVTTEKIVNETIDKQDLATGSVTSEKILDGTILTVDIADNAINSSKIEDLSVQNEDFANNAITTDKILDGTIVNQDIKDKTITSIKLDGTGWQPGTVATVQSDGTVIYATLLADASNISKVKDLKSTAGDNSVSVTNGRETLLKEATLHVTDNSISTLKIADNAVVNSKLADNAVTSNKILNQTIITEDLANNAVSTNKILDGNVTLNKLANSSVNSDKIVNESVVNQDISNRTIEVSKLDGSGHPQGHVLTVINTNGAVVYKAQEVEASNITGAGNLTSSDGSVTVANGSQTTILNTSVNVSDLGITTDKLAELSVTNQKIVDSAVNSAKILDNSILNQDIANKTIAVNKLEGGSNNNGKVATVTDNLGNVQFVNLEIPSSQITNAGRITTTTPLKVNGTNTLLGATLIDTNLSVDTASNNLGVVKQGNNAATRTINIQAGIPSVNATPLAGNGLQSNSDILYVDVINGLQILNNQVVLGGSLITPTTIITTAANNFALTNLITASADYSYVTIDNSNGVVKKSKSAKPEYFYSPSIALPVVPDGLTNTGDISYNLGVYSVNLHNIYTKQYGMQGNVSGANRTAIKNPNAGNLHVYSSSDLEYYITYFDNKVFNPNSISISAAGVITYTVLPNSEVTENTYMNVIFKVK